MSGFCAVFCAGECIAAFADRADALWWARARSIRGGGTVEVFDHPTAAAPIAAFRLGSDAPPVPWEPPAMSAVEAAGGRPARTGRSSSRTGGR